MAVDRIVAIVGVGPGLGASLARRFAARGFATALIARTPNQVEPEAAQIRNEGGRALAITADASDPDSLRAAFARIRNELGHPDVLIHNASAFVPGGVLDLEPAQFEQVWRVTALGALVGAQEVLPAMISAGRGTILLTGATASVRGGARFAAFSSAKFALRALAQSMAREFGPKGVHVAHVIIDGQIDTPLLRQTQPDRDPTTALSPDAIADVYLRLHLQHPTTWTHELDLRPATERF